MKIRWLVNVDVLTTGFDAQCVDAICILRATASPGLFAQIVGRGLRTHPSKSDCLVLDFGSNIERHGPIDAIDYGRPRNRKGGGSAETDKICPNCESFIPKKDRLCECGFEFFERAPNHDQKADTEAEILSLTEPETFTVAGATYSRHEKDGKVPSLRVTYTLEEANMPFGLSEWVCIEHTGFAYEKAFSWWHMRCNVPMPKTTREAVEIAKAGGLAATLKIKVKRIAGDKFPKIVGYELGEKPDSFTVTHERQPGEDDEEFVYEVDGKTYEVPF
jgi:DNA repair protein RadD